MEPISPELVLVDPDLATRVRAVPAERPSPGPKRTLGDDAAAQRAGGADVRPGSTLAFKRLSAVLLGIGLMACGFLAAAAVSGTNSEPQPVSPPDGGAALAPDVVTQPATVGTVRRQRAASAARTTVRARPAAKPRRRADANRRSNVAPRRRRQTPARAAAAETSAAVERKLLTVIVQSPAGKLPPALIDGKTGLAKNNLQAVCTPSSDAQSFVCVVTSAIQPGAPPVYAHYRPTRSGRGAFTWYRSRTG
jgi:hypothetical protein